MNRKEALKKATYLAREPIKNREDAKSKHVLLNQLFKQFHLSWDEINEEAQNHGKEQ